MTDTDVGNDYTEGISTQRRPPPRPTRPRRGHPEQATLAAMAASPPGPAKSPTATSCESPSTKKIPHRLRCHPSSTPTRAQAPPPPRSRSRRAVRAAPPPETTYRLRKSAAGSGTIRIGYQEKGVDGTTESRRTLRSIHTHPEHSQHNLSARVAYEALALEPELDELHHHEIDQVWNVLRAGHEHLHADCGTIRYFRRLLQDRPPYV